MSGPARGSLLTRVPAAFLLAVGIVAGLEAAAADTPRVLGFLCAQTRPVDAENFLRADLYLDAARFSNARSRVFLVGPSNAREGINAGALNQAFAEQGVEFFNLGASSFQMSDLYQWRARIAAARPDAILYLVNPQVFFKTNEVERKTTLIFDPSIVPWLVRYLPAETIWRDRAKYLDGALGYLSRLYRFRLLLRRLSDRRAAGGSFRERPVQFFYKARLSEAQLRVVLKKYVKADYFEDDPETRMQRALFEPTLEYLKDKGVRVIFVEFPLHPSAGGIYRPEYYRRFRDRMLGSRERLAYDFVPVEELPVFTKEDYYDLVHLGAPGRKKLTSFAEELFRQRLTAART